MTVEQIKQRFGIIGSSPLLNRAIDIAMQVAATDISVLITGQSGVGKEFFPKIIHSLSHRKHKEYIAINCGAIPGGTIESELFGHEKGSFTDARDMRKGYFEVANEGTIFLDEVAELPLQTQVRLLRVLETGEFMRVGSSKALKTNVRVVAATNINLQEAINAGRFREDLFYRLNTIPIYVPSLSQRKEDINLLFRKFANDVAEKYRMPIIKLNEDAQLLLSEYRWPGNIRQLKNFTEQISIIEEKREIDADTLRHYLPLESDTQLPVLFNKDATNGSISDRDLIYKVLFEMKKEVTDLKRLVYDIMKGDAMPSAKHNLDQSQLFKEIYEEEDGYFDKENNYNLSSRDHHEPIQEPEIYEPKSLSLQDTEIEMIKKALEKYRGKRRYAAKELGISERTLYRKIKEYNME